MDERPDPATLDDGRSARGDADETPGLPPGTAPAVPGFGPPAAPGEVGTLGRYRVASLLGRGGMGAVYLAFDTRLRRKVALKVMLPQEAAEPGARERFVREARAAAKVTHDHVVTVYEAGELRGVPYIAMQLLRGYPLDEYLKKKGEPTVPQVLRIAREAAAGLAAAHAAGLVHRDVKPGNLWLEAPHGRVKVLDFGLAKPVAGGGELSGRGAVVGTPKYMSPEQARGEEVDARTDLFSLGAVLYRLATGHLPFDGPHPLAVLSALTTADPRPVRGLNPAVPEPLAELIHHLLAKDPAARPASAAEVVRRARAIAGPAPTAATPDPTVVYVPIEVTVLERPSPFADLDVTEDEPASAEPAAAPARARPGGWWPWVAAAAAAVLAAAAVGLVVVLKDRGRPDGRGPGGPVAGDKGKAPVPAPPGDKPPTRTDPDGRAAEWVLSLGGRVKVDGNAVEFKDPADLPKDRFELSLANLNDIVVTDHTRVTDAGLAHLRDLKGLKHLYLQGAPVTDAGLAHLKDLKGLTTLGLSGTRVGDAGLAHLAGCKALAQLSLATTGVTDAGLAHLKGLSSLNTLSLQHTPVAGPGLAHLKDLRALGLLDLTGTRVGDDGLAHLAGCRVRVLTLAGAPVTGPGLAHLKDLPALTTLTLYGTKVGDAELAHLAGCTGLRTLDLQSTSVTGPGLAHLKELPALSTLSLRGPKVGDAGLAHLKDCPALTDLALISTGVGDAGLALLGGCAGLRTLNLHDTKVTDAGLAHLKGLKRLASLSLNAVPVTDAGLAHLRELKGLTRLDLRGTKVTAAAAKEFQAAVRGCEVLHATGTLPAPVPAAPDPDRRAAEWVLSVGGTVRVTGDDRDLGAAEDLPTGPFELTAVSLAGAPVADADLTRLKDCKGLTELSLAGTKVAGAVLFQLKDLPRLAHLDLRDTKVAGAPLAHLPKFKALAHLNLSGTPVADGGMVQVKACEGLRSLDLAGTKVGDVGLPHLKNLNGLASLDVRRTGVTGKAVAAFRAAVPGCRVEHDAGPEP